MADFEGPPAPASRDRWLKEDELTALLKGSATIPAPGGPYIRLLLILGQRRNEVSELDWRELNRAQRTWVMPAARAKNGVEHLVALSDYAINEFDALAGGDKWPKRGLVFTTNKTAPVSGFSKLKKKIDAAMLEDIRSSDPHAEVTPWRLHDLRRSAATHMQRLNTPNEHIEAVQNRLAGRSKPGAGKSYLLWDFEPEKREALERWGSFLSSLLADRHNVVQLAKAG